MPFATCRETCLREWEMAKSHIYRWKKLQFRRTWWPPLLSSWFTKGATTSVSSIHGRRRYSDWGGISYQGKMEIKFIIGKLNSEKYVKMIDEQINTYTTRMVGNEYIFQRDNAAVHTKKQQNKEIRVLV